MTLRVRVQKKYCNCCLKWAPILAALTKTSLNLSSAKVVPAARQSACVKPNSFDLMCPRCGECRHAKKARLTRGGCWRSLACKVCRKISSSSMWRCPCGIRWHHCPKHFQLARENERCHKTAESLRAAARKRKAIAVTPAFVRQFAPPVLGPVVDVANNQKRAKLMKLGPRLAARFPHCAA